MMAGIMSYFGGRRDPKQSSRDAIVTLRQQLQMIEKKEDYLQKKIEEETKKAKQYYWRPLGKISRWDPEDDL